MEEMSCTHCIRNFTTRWRWTVNFILSLL